MIWMGSLGISSLQEERCVLFQMLVILKLMCEPLLECLRNIHAGSHDIVPTASLYGATHVLKSPIVICGTPSAEAVEFKVLSDAKVRQSTSQPATHFICGAYEWFILLFCQQGSCQPESDKWFMPLHQLYRASPLTCFRVPQGYVSGKVVVNVKVITTNAGFDGSQH